jgi:hypothetical protein
MKRSKKARTASASKKSINVKKKSRRPKATKPKRQKRKKRGSYKLRMNAASIRAAGMLVPEAIDLEGTTLHKLTKEWYKKLEKDGVHEEIEWAGGSVDSLGTGSPYLKRPDQTRIKYAKINSYEYYRLCACYLAHNKSWLEKGDALIWAGFTEGTTYRDIQKAFNKRVKPRRSLFYIFTRIKVLCERMEAWHREHPEGLRNGREDFHVDDVLLREPDPVLKAD